MNDKFILDACCGGRGFWFNKHHKNVLYIDNRIEEKGHDIRRPNHEVKPDIKMDFRDLKFKDKSFKLIVFDPPYFTRNEGFKAKSSMVHTYGYLNPKDWKKDIKKGFDECWRVLEDNGILIFKWNTMQISKKDILEVLGKEFLFGHTTKNYTNTIWFCFMKIPEGDLK